MTKSEAHLVHESMCAVQHLLDNIATIENFPNGTATSMVTVEKNLNEIRAHLLDVSEHVRRVDRMALAEMRHVS